MTVYNAMNNKFNAVVIRAGGKFSLNFISPIGTGDGGQRTGEASEGLHQIFTS